MDYILLIITILLGIISSYIASYFFLLFFIKSKKPKIIISNHISKVEFKGETNYLFKFVNKTKSEIFDIKVEPKFYKPFGDTKGKNLNGKDIQLEDNFFMHIPQQKEDDKFNLHAMRVRTLKELDTEWTDEASFIGLTIIAKHSLSGLSKVFYKEFNTVDCITEKKFASGDDLNVY